MIEATSSLTRSGYTCMKLTPKQFKSVKRLAKKLNGPKIFGLQSDGMLVSEHAVNTEDGEIEA